MLSLRKPHCKIHRQCFQAHEHTSNQYEHFSRPTPSRRPLGCSTRRCRCCGM